MQRKRIKMSNFIIRSKNRIEKDNLTLKSYHIMIPGIIFFHRFTKEILEDDGIHITKECFISIFEKIVREWTKESIRKKSNGYIRKIA